MIESDTPVDESDHSYENVDEEKIRDHGGTLRVVVWVVSAVIAVVMVAMPIMRIVDWGGDDDDADPRPSEERAFVATRWTDAALVRRSVNDAVRWSAPELRDTIGQIVTSLERRPAADFAGAAVSVARVTCDIDTDSDSECFQAWIRQPGGTDLIRVRLVITVVDGDAFVTAIDRVNVV